MGEVRGRAWRHQPPVSPLRGEAPEGFDFGNSPFEISVVDFWGKTVIVMIFVMMTIIIANGE
jgi:hypothetical protein